ncbi:MAG: hypothetical protein ACFB0D_07305 [Phormidesmis sp.]
MTSAKPKWPKLLRWLSPLLLASLGLHGLGLLLPVPETEEIERPEFVEPESIQVSTLPPTLKPPAPEPAPPPLPPAVVPPPVVEPVQEAFPFQEDALLEEEIPPEVPPEEIPPEDDDSSFEESDADSQDDDIQDDDSSDEEPSSRNAYNEQGTSDADFQLAAISFSANYPGVAVQTNVPLALTYTADKECFDPLPGEVQMGAAINNSGGVVETALFRKSGYQKIDDWIEDIVGFDELPPESFARLSISDGYLPDWINETRNNGADPLVPTGEDAKAYAIQVIVTVEGNRCE